MICTTACVPSVHGFLDDRRELDVDIGEPEIKRQYIDVALLLGYVEQSAKWLDDVTEGE